MSSLISELQKLSSEAGENTARYFGRILICLIIFFVGRKVIKYFVRLVDKSFARTKMEESLKGFLLGMIRAALYVMMAMAIIDQLGIGTSTIVAVAGTASLSIGLALQGSLANFAGGVLILLMKPFVVGDYITAGTDAGTVKSIDIFYTRLVTPDNRTIVIPNGSLSNMSLTNSSSTGTRRLDLAVNVDYHTDLEAAKEILLGLAKADPRILTNLGAFAFVNELKESGVELGLHVWVDSLDYLAVKFALTEEIHRAFQEKGIEIPYNKLDVNLVTPKNGEEK